jgi:hypothetical protein
MIDGSSRADLKSRPGKLTVRFRLLGLLPLIFFALHARYYLEAGGLSHMLWMCNIGNLVLAIGLFLAWPPLIRLAVIWLLPGLPIWLLFVVTPGVWIPTSFVAHAGGLVVEPAAGLGFTLLSGICSFRKSAECSLHRG